MLDIIYSVIITLALTVAIVNEYYSYKLKVVPMASLPWVTEQITGYIQQQDLPANAVIYELGSGWGGLAYKLARTCPSCQVKGYELSPFPFLWAWLMKRRANLSFYRADILQQSYGDAAVIVFYLMPHLIDRLYPILQQSAPKGTLLIASGFPIKDAKEIQAIPMKNGLENRYIFISYKRCL